MEKQKLKIIIVDDNETFRINLKYYCEEFLSYNVINDANDGESFLALNNIHDADIILMDIKMPKINGIAATKKIIEENNHIKIIAITAYQDKAYLLELLQSGFKGCVFKNSINKEITIAVNKVMHGELYFPDDIKIERSKL